MNEFLKAATTSVSVDKTQADIIATLNRYGASGFGFRRRGATVEATFHLPSKSGGDRTVSIPVNVETVREKLTAFQAARIRKGAHVGKTVAVEQAERVAWRALLLWIEASLLAVALGAQSMEEAFFAHMIVETEDGQRGRVVDYFGMLTYSDTGKLPNPNRLLLSGVAS